MFELCSSTDNMRTRLAIGMGILFFQQVCMVVMKMNKSLKINLSLNSVPFINLFYQLLKKYNTLQFTGQPSVLYYAPTLFESIGYGSNTAAALQTVGLGIVKVSLYMDSAHVATCVCKT